MPDIFFNERLVDKVVMAAIRKGHIRETISR